MNWRLNFLNDKRFRYINDPKKNIRDYIAISVIGSVVTIIFVLYVLPFLILHVEFKPLQKIVFSAFVIFVIIWKLNLWIVGDYMRYSLQPIKLKISDEGLEIINMFGRYRRIQWDEIKNIEYSEKLNMYVAKIIPNPKPPPIIAPRKINIGLDLEIGPMVLKYWESKRKSQHEIGNE